MVVDSLSGSVFSLSLLPAWNEGAMPGEEQPSWGHEDKSLMPRMRAGPYKEPGSFTISLDGCTSLGLLMSKNPGN